MDGQTHCTIRPFRDGDPDISRDPLSTNRRLFDSGGIELFGSMIHTDSGFYHLHGGRDIPRRCPACDRFKAGTGRKSGLYLASGGPALVFVRKFAPANTDRVNNTGCPHCQRLIRVNMSRHLRALHTDNQCFWRCPVSTCHLWFSSELNRKVHLERIHGFREGQGCSFYECLRRYGMKWFGKRSYFDQREQSSQAMWMDIALARQSGQELQNHYIITNSPATAHMRRFFRASIRRLTATYQRIAADRRSTTSGCPSATRCDRT